MYTSEIGKIIFETWKKESGQSISVKEYFDQVFFPIFFDNKKYLMLAKNSKFDQAYIQKGKRPLTADVRLSVLQDFHNVVASLKKRESHVFMGGYNRSNTSSTSSQVSQLNIQLKSEDVYYSWLGMATGIGVKGGVSLLIDDTNILKILVEGWRYYRQYMNANETLKPHQIDSWNGWWLIHHSKTLSHSDPMASFPPANSISVKDGISSFDTPPWISVLFAIAKIANEDRIISYIYSFGKMNTSIGFVPIVLKDLTKLSSLYQKLFGSNDYVRERSSLETLYETQLGFFQACRIGSIGLQAIEPKGLRKYLASRGERPKSIKVSNNNHITFNLYQTWIIAMLNNEDLLLAAQEFAEALSKIGSSARGKKGLSTAVKVLLEANSKAKFIDAVTALISDRDFAQSPAAEEKEVFDSTVKELAKMPASNVPLFLTLLRFKYAYLNL